MWAFLGLLSLLSAAAQKGLAAVEEGEEWEWEECSALDGRFPPPHCADEINIAVLGPPQLCPGKAEALAKRHSLILKGEVKGMPCHFTFAHAPASSHTRHRRSITASLSEDEDVEWAAADVIKVRKKRGTLAPAPPNLPFSDPNYNDQWYLHNGAEGNFDMWVKGAWALGYSGVNVSVSILDDGIQPTHPDLAANYDALASTDINDHDDDPTPRDNNDNKHGTRCAGEVAAVAGNDWCGVGVAYNGRIGGVRMLDGPVSDRVEAASLHHNQHHIAIYSASWGPEDDGRTFDGPGPLAKRAFLDGVTSGRGGLGNIFIWASGNGGAHADSCSCDGYTTSIYTLSVSSATFDNRKPWYLEECPSTIASTYSSAGAGQPAIVTTDMPNSCTKYHTGTSASAPMAAGIVALALEANPRLSWRDMQHLVLRTADPTALLNNPGWSTNGVGRRISNKFGYGIMHAENLVREALRWQPVPEQHNCTVDYVLPVDAHGSPEPIQLTGIFNVSLSLNVSGCDSVRYLEQLQVILTVRMSRRGDLKLTLISPSGTRSVILPKRPGDANRSGFHKWPFLSVQQWGEDPRGIWTLRAENAGFARTTGTLLDWSLLLYGTSEPAQRGDSAQRGTSSTPGWEAEEKVLGFFRRAVVEAESPSPSPPPSPLSSSTSFTHTLHSTNDSTAPVAGETGASVHPSEGQGSLLFQGCHAECSPAQGCRAPNDSTACVQCLHLKETKANRGGVRCVSACGQGWWAEGSTCRQCRKGCLACHSTELCSKCDSHLYLVMADLDSFHHGTCVDACPPSFTLYPEDGSCRLQCGLLDCEICASRNTCAKCRSPLRLHSSTTKCVAGCGSSEWEKDGACLPCPSMCARCRNDTSCEECGRGTRWEPERKYCVLQGTGDSNDALACPQPCGAGQFCDRSRWECGSCHASCKSCQGPVPTACLSCHDGSQPQGGRCLSSPTQSQSSTSAEACPEGQFSDVSGCSPCHPSCLRCTGRGPHECSACKTGESELRGGFCRLCCGEARTIARSTQYSAVAIGASNCVTCAARPPSSKNIPAPTSNSIALATTLAILLAFVGLVACFLCRDGRSNYAYKKIPNPNFLDNPRSGPSDDEDDSFFTQTPHR